LSGAERLLFRRLAAFAGGWSLAAAEGDRWLTGTLARAETADLPLPLRATLLQGVGTIAWRQGDQARASTLMDAALALFRLADDRFGVAAVLHNLGVLAEGRGDYDRARVLYEESVEIRTALGDRPSVARTLLQLGNVARQQGDPAVARVRYEHALRLHQELGDPHSAAMALGSLGNLAQDQGEARLAEARFAEALVLFREIGDTTNSALTLNHLGLAVIEWGDYAAAAAYQLEGLRLAREVGDRHTQLFLLEGLGMTAARQGQGRRAVRLLGASERAREDLAFPVAPSARAPLAALVARVRELLGETDFTLAWGEGRALNLDAAGAEALRPPAPGTPMPPGLSSLSPREREVAALIGTGQTNAQLAATLGMSARTADTHVGHILRKLGVGSRADVAALLTAAPDPTEH
jgi:non-specific serine/threonine protein kinase